MALSDNPNNPKPGVLFQHQSNNSIVSVKTQGKESKSMKGCVQKNISKKTLVRNTEVAVYPTNYRTDHPNEEPKVSSSPPSGSKNVFYKTNLVAPSLNSALRLVKEMKEVSSTKPSKTQCARLLDEGKVLQQVNFVYEEHLYHDLVALNVSDSALMEIGTRPTSKYKSREKDKEPKLSQFFTPSFSEEFDIPREPLLRDLNGLNTSSTFSIYERMKTWDPMN